MPVTVYTSHFCLGREFYFSNEQLIKLSCTPTSQTESCQTTLKSQPQGFNTTGFPMPENITETENVGFQEASDEVKENLILN